MFNWKFVIIVIKVRRSGRTSIMDRWIGLYYCRILPDLYRTYIHTAFVKEGLGKFRLKY